MSIRPEQRQTIVATPEQRKRWHRAAKATERSVSAWARYHLDRAASLDLQQHGIREYEPEEQRRAS